MRFARRTVLQAAAAVIALPACQASLTSPPVVGSGPVAFGRGGLRAEVDLLRHRLTLIGPSGSRTVGGAGLEVGRLNGPVAVVALEDRFYVVERGNHRVQAFDARGESVAVFGGFNYPGGLAVFGDRLLVADSRNGRLVELHPRTGATRVLEGAALSAPSGLAVQGERVLVADPGLHRVLELDADGRLVRTLGEGWVLPSGVAVDAEHTFVADPAAAELVVLDHLGRRRDSIPLARGATFVSLAHDGRLVVA